MVFETVSGGSKRQLLCNMPLRHATRRKTLRCAHFPYTPVPGNNSPWAFPPSRIPDCPLFCFSC